MFIIFLDIHEVLFKGFSSCTPSEQYDAKFNEYYEHKSTYAKYIYAGILRDYAHFQAQTHFFDQAALENLAKLIAHIKSKEPQVGIVLSSKWREYFDVEALKKLLKLLHFADLIIDKLYDEAGIHLADETGLASLPRQLNHAELIELWLKQHPETADKFLILDHTTYGLRELFPRNFVHCDSLYGETEYNRSISLIDKLLDLNNTAATLPLESKVIPTAVKTFAGARNDSQLLPPLSMRILLSTRASFINMKLDQNTPFSGQGKIQNLILEYEEGESCEPAKKLIR